ncbi:MAG: 3-hydroxyacyl-CoA dehydrogenase NAD-binding domain-containing protein [Myxococcota bacterium]|nr:3-hydroxyacyl-CoA dehydrogenase NAD-binding domain-containing protein [Myxococcota bacterium]
MITAKSIGVLGSGVMGTKLAQKIAQEGLQVILVDVKPEIVERSLDTIERRLTNEARDAEGFGEDPKDVLARIQITTDPALLKRAKLVLEAVTEDKDTKKAALRHIGEICSKETVFATSTCTLRVSDIAKAIPNPGRVLGLHYFDHAGHIPIIEVVRGTETPDATLKWGLEAVQAFGCASIVSKDTPGCIVNRLTIAVFNEAVRLSVDGQINLQTIDAAAREVLGVSTGPFAMMNALGIQAVERIAAGLYELGEPYIPPRRLTVQATSGAPWDLVGDVDKARKQEAADALLGTAIVTGASIFQDDISRLEDIELGAKLGAGWHMGPFELANALGPPRADQLASTVAQSRGFHVPPVLIERAETATPWSLRYIDLTVQDGVAAITINRPDVMNALCEPAIDQLAQAVDKVGQDPTVRAVVFSGAGKALACGLQPEGIADRLRAGKLDDVITLFGKIQAILRRIEAMDKMTIVRASGLTLGGGLELGLACKVMVSGPRARFAFPETGQGIHPGLGGTQRLPRKVGKSIGKYLILTGDVISAQAAYRLGIVDALADDEKGVDQIIGEIAAGDGFVQEDLAPTAEELAKISLFNAQNSHATLAGKLPDENGAAKQTAAALAIKAPVALKLADKLIEDGLALDLERALNWELSSLKLILQTGDALRGLESNGHERPVFRGE